MATSPPRLATITFGPFNLFNQPQVMKDARGNYTVMKYDVKGNLLEEIKPDAKLGLLSLKAMAKGIQDVFCVQLEPLRFTAKGTSFIRQRCPEAHDWIGISLLTY